MARGPKALLNCARHPAQTRLLCSPKLVAEDIHRCYDDILPPNLSLDGADPSEIATDPAFRPEEVPEVSDESDCQDEDEVPAEQDGKDEDGEGFGEAKDAGLGTAVATRSNGNIFYSLEEMRKMEFVDKKAATDAKKLEAKDTTKTKALLRKNLKGCNEQEWYTIKIGARSLWQTVFKTYQQLADVDRRRRCDGPSAQWWNSLRILAKPNICPGLVVLGVKKDIRPELERAVASFLDRTKRTKPMIKMLEQMVCDEGDDVVLNESEFVFLYGSLTKVDLGRPLQLTLCLRCMEFARDYCQPVYSKHLVALKPWWEEVLVAHFMEHKKSGLGHRSWLEQNKMNDFALDVENCFKIQDMIGRTRNDDPLANEDWMILSMAMASKIGCALYSNVFKMERRKRAEAKIREAILSLVGKAVTDKTKKELLQKLEMHFGKKCMNEECESWRAILHVWASGVSSIGDFPR